MPRETIQFLSVDEAIEIHDRLIQRFGGASGIRDHGLLESALFRPRTGYYKDLAEMAAALFESLVNNRAFVDGNKKMAFFCTDVFLRLNGWKVQFEGPEAYRFIVTPLEGGNCDMKNLLPWFQENLTRL